MATKLEFERYLKQGREDEERIANWLRREMGFTILPVYTAEQGHRKGPRLFTPTKTLIAPDILAIGPDGITVWVEAKGKDAFTPHHISGGTLCTGIDISKYNDYVEVSEAYPFPVWLMFLQKGGIAKGETEPTPAGLYWGDLAYLKNHVHHSFREGVNMVYWSIDVLTKWADIDEL